MTNQRLSNRQIATLKHLAVCCSNGGQVTLTRDQREAMAPLCRRGLIEMWFRCVPDEGSTRSPFFRPKRKRLAPDQFNSGRAKRKAGSMTDQPKRIKLSREKGWRLPANAVKVDRTTAFGNPYRVGEPIDMKQVRRWGWEISPEGRKIVCEDAASAVGRFAHCLFWDSAIHDFVREELKGKDLACWCEIGDPCHADTLLVVANSDPSEIRCMQDLMCHRIIAEAQAVMERQR